MKKTKSNKKSSAVEKQKKVSIDKRVLIVIIIVVALLILILLLKSITGYAVAGVPAKGCYDSDGGKMFYTKGLVYVNSVLKGTDTCRTTKVLREYYCLANVSKNVDQTCALNCVNGACNCTKKTCSQLGKQCGNWADGCEGTVDCGSCSSGQTCNNGQCVCTPTTEVCDNKDNDCDGQIDEGVSKSCGTSDVGSCKLGTQTCSTGNWSSCIGNIDPRPEACDGLLDDDCDGVVDNGCSCTNGDSKSCGLTDVGECQLGNSLCIFGQWGNCTGDINPTTEICDNKDNDCNFGIDENLSDQCGVSNVGECRFGTTTCNLGIWGNCNGNVDPVTEVCDGRDNDCDGTIDENCLCIDSQNKSCGSNIGECRTGEEICSGGIWGACFGETLPSTETCDNKDNDCDGLTDEDLSITCTLSTDCGTAGWTGNAYCMNNSVYRNWLTYQCNNGGKCSSSCSSASTPSLNLNCANGCSNGACLAGGYPNSCIDSDGDNVRVFGNVSGYFNNATYANVDTCLNNMTIKEFYCSGNTARNYNTSCITNSTYACYSGRCV